MAPFAGWDMPTQFEGVLVEHAWCRSSAALFDVSHMAVVELRPEPGNSEGAVANALERLTPAGITTLAVGRQRYGLLLNDDGGIVDDFMVTNWGGHLTMVVNASRREVDLALLRDQLPEVDVVERTDVALLALQGPQAAAVLADMADSPNPYWHESVFLDNQQADLGPATVLAARAGYTGEDGFELVVPASSAEALARRLLDDQRVRPAGLGARDTLRLEAGLCLYGNDLDETISPVEADLVWTMPKRRREAGDFPGGSRIIGELADGPSRVRVGLQPEGRRPVRDGAALFAASEATDGGRGQPVGVVSSGGFGPTVEQPVAMAYVSPDASEVGTALVADVRGKDVNCRVAALPFVPHQFRR